MMTMKKMIIIPIIACIPMILMTSMERLKMRRATPGTRIKMVGIKISAGGLLTSCSSDLLFRPESVLLNQNIFIFKIILFPFPGSASTEELK